MKRSFEDYLIMVGIRSFEYTYTDEQLFGNTEYFKKCYRNNLSEYKALLFLQDYMEENRSENEKSKEDCDYPLYAIVGCGREDYDCTKCNYSKQTG